MCVSHPSPTSSLSSSRPETSKELPCSPFPGAIPTSNIQQIWLGRHGKTCSFSLITQPDHKGFFLPYDGFSENCPHWRLCCSRLDKPQPLLLPRMRRIFRSKIPGHSPIPSSTVLNTASVIIIPSEIQQTTLSKTSPSVCPA